jgi:hypothetical protein
MVYSTLLLFGRIDISSKTSITVEEIYYTLKDRKMIHTPLDDIGSPQMPVARIKNKSRRRKGGGLGHGRHTDEDSIDVPENYRIEFDREEAEEYVRRWEDKGYLDLKPEKLRWTPFLVTRAFNLVVDGGSTAREPAEERPPEKEHVRVVEPRGEEPVVVDHQGAEVIPDPPVEAGPPQDQQPPSTVEPQPSDNHQANGVNGDKSKSKSPGAAPTPSDKEKPTPRRSARTGANGTPSSPATPRRLTRASMTSLNSIDQNRSEGRPQRLKSRQSGGYEGLDMEVDAEGSDDPDVG